MLIHIYTMRISYMTELFFERGKFDVNKNSPHISLNSNFWSLSPSTVVKD